MKTEFFLLILYCHFNVFLRRTTYDVLLLIRSSVMKSPVAHFPSETTTGNFFFINGAFFLKKSHLCSSISVLGTFIHFNTIFLKKLQIIYRNSIFFLEFCIFKYYMCCYYVQSKTYIFQKK